MFSRDEDFEQIKEGLAAMGGDMSAFRSWQKIYEKVSKQWPTLQRRYEDALSATRQVEKYAEQMEQMLISDAGVEPKEFAFLLKELKCMQNSFDHEFLISSEDHEFHSTYDTILKLGVKALETSDQRLILQSEIENLLALLRENLDKEAPDGRWLCVYYLSGSDRELAKLAPAERQTRIRLVYHEKFVKPFLKLVSPAIAKARAEVDRLAAEENRRSRKTLDAIQIFLKGEGDPENCARGLLEELMV